MLSYLLKYRLLQQRRSRREEILLQVVIPAQIQASTTLRNRCDCYPCRVVIPVQIQTSTTYKYTTPKMVTEVVIPAQIQASTTFSTYMQTSRWLSCHTCSNTGFYNWPCARRLHRRRLSYLLKYRLLQLPDFQQQSHSLKLMTFWTFCKS